MSKLTNRKLFVWGMSLQLSFIFLMVRMSFHLKFDGANTHVSFLETTCPDAIRSQDWELLHHRRPSTHHRGPLKSFSKKP